MLTVTIHTGVISPRSPRTDFSGHSVVIGGYPVGNSTSYGDVIKNRRYKFQNSPDRRFKFGVFL